MFSSCGPFRQLRAMTASLIRIYKTSAARHRQIVDAASSRTVWADVQRLLAEQITSR